MALVGDAASDFVQALSPDAKLVVPVTIDRVPGGISVTFQDFPLYSCVVRHEGHIYLASFGECVVRARSLRYALNRLSSLNPFAAAAVEWIRPIFAKATALETHAEFERIRERFYGQFRIY